MYHSFFNSSPIKGRLGHFQFVAIMIKIAATAAAAKSLQSCPTLYNRIDGSPQGSPVPGILKTRTD